MYLKSNILVVKVLSLEAANEAGVFLDFLSVVFFRPEEKQCKLITMVLNIMKNDDWK